MMTHCAFALLLLALLVLLQLGSSGSPFLVCAGGVQSRPVLMSQPSLDSLPYSVLAHDEIGGKYPLIGLGDDSLPSLDDVVELDGAERTMPDRQLEDIPMDTLLPHLDTPSLVQLSRTSNFLRGSVRSFVPALDSREDTLRQRMQRDCGVWVTKRILQMRYPLDPDELEHSPAFLIGFVVRQLTHESSCRQSVTEFCRNVEAHRQGSSGHWLRPLRLRHPAVLASELGAVLETLQSLHEACSVELSIHLHGWSETNYHEQLRTVVDLARKDTALAVLSLGGLNLEDIAGVNLLESLLAEGKTLRAFGLAYSRLEPWHLFKLFAGLQKNPRIISLALPYNNLHVHSVRALGELLESVPWLQRLDLRSNALDSACMQNFWMALRQHPSLRSLDLSYNDLGAEGARFLSMALLENKRLEELFLSGNKRLLTGGVFRIMESIAVGGSRIQKLALGDMDMGESSVRAVTQFLGRTQIRELDLSGNPMFRDSLYYLMNSLEGNQNLQVLHLRAVGLGFEGACQIQKRIKKLRYLKRLHLDQNCMGTISARVLARGLRENRSLEEVSITDNQIGPAGVEALVKLLAEPHPPSSETAADRAGKKRQNMEPTPVIPPPALKTLSLWGNRVDERGRQRLAKIPIPMERRALLEAEPVSPLLGNGRDTWT